MAKAAAATTTTLGPMIVLLSLTTLSVAAAAGVHDLLRSRGLPAGLIPKNVKSYRLSESGLLEVELDGPCLTKYDTRAHFDAFISANLTTGSLIGVVGLSQEELFLWLPVRDITVDSHRSGVIVFDIVVAHKHLSLSLFEEPPDCKPQGFIMKNKKKKGSRKEVERIGNGESELKVAMRDGQSKPQ